MREWMRAHKSELDRERTVFFNIDMAGTGSVRWMEKEGLVLAMRYHPTLDPALRGDRRGPRA